jgi:hypothetical protein
MLIRQTTSEIVQYKNIVAVDIDDKEVSKSMKDSTTYFVNLLTKSA